jgi:kynureninase
MRCSLHGIHVAHIVSVMIFQTFSCHDVGAIDQDMSYMTADYSVSCASDRYAFAFWWAFAMVFVYPIGKPSMRSWGLQKGLLLLKSTIYSTSMYVLTIHSVHFVVIGIPVVYFLLLYSVRDMIGSVSGPDGTFVSMLYEEYRSKYWYWAVVDALYRVSVTVSPHRRL